MRDDSALGEEEQARRRAAFAELFPETPFLRNLGLVVDSYLPDRVVIRVPFRPDLTNDGSRYHGGVVAAAVDTAGAAAAWSNHDFSKGARGATVSISIQYVGACNRSDLVCRGRTVRRARELVFSEVEATDAEGTTVAHGHLTYRIVP